MPVLSFRDRSIGEPFAALARRAFDRAAALDATGDPSDDVADIKASGVLGLPIEAAAVSMAQLDRLRAMGRSSLPLGRLYEGHVNALQLVAAFGTPAQQRRACGDAAANKLFGVWNTDAADPVRLVTKGNESRLTGAKFFASGAGFVERPLITARREDGGVQMIVLPLDDGGTDRTDPSGWTPLGMRASASGRIDLTDLVVAPRDLLGGPGDYHRQPWFSGGAIRFLAVQLGGAEALGDLFRTHLKTHGRGGDPYQKARLGHIAVALETARLWLAGAAALAADRDRVAYTNLARTAIERACLDVMELATRGIGVQALLRPHPFERVLRDLTTYLRQPAPDAALAQAGDYVLSTREPIDRLWSSL